MLPLIGCGSAALGNTASLYSCVMFAKGITNDSQFIERALSTIRATMEVDGLSDIYQNFIAPSSATVTFAKALNRKVTGSIREVCDVFVGFRNGLAT